MALRGRGAVSKAPVEDGGGAWDATLVRLQHGAAEPRIRRWRSPKPDTPGSATSASPIRSSPASGRPCVRRGVGIERRAWVGGAAHRSVLRGNAIVLPADLIRQRGTGLSDRVSNRELSSLETRMDDVRAVMDVAGSDRAVLLALPLGGPMSVLFAATYPDRVVVLAH
jgi:hypothetical protein